MVIAPCKFLAKRMRAVRERYSSDNRNAWRIALGYGLLFALTMTEPAADSLKTRPPHPASIKETVASVARQVAELGDGKLWLATQLRLEEAQSALAAGDLDTARRLADRVSFEASSALNQLQLERARYWLKRRENDLGSDLRRAVEGFLRAYDGAAALSLLQDEFGELN